MPPDPVALDGATTLTAVLTGSPAVPLSPADYRGDHHDLLVEIGGPQSRAPASDGPTRPDVIVIPVARSLRTSLPGVELGYRLASELDIPLVLQCSRDARPVDLDAALRADERVKAEVVDPAELSWRRSFRAHRHPLSSLHRSNDVGPKRSEALLLAARCGWDQVLFLDDDVWPAEDGSRTLDAASLRAASAVLAADGLLRVVGWTSDDFPDNSVYGHARRLVGEQQTVFIGSGALLVKVDEKTPFFPDIYNEDWLFMIESALRGEPKRAMGHAGGVNQLRYWPFRIDRARSEETGDLFAEALMNLLEDDPGGLRSEARNKDWWRDALQAREERLADARRALATLASAPGASARERQDANTALLAAEGVRAIVPPYALAEYYAEWQEDLGLWGGLMGEAISAGEKALAMS